MWTLIKRETEDHIVKYLIAFVASLIAIVIYLVHNYRALDDLPVGIPHFMYVIMWIPLTILPLCVSCFGCHQMQTDKTRKIASFLSTLATSRQQILTARIIAGSILFLVPLALLMLTDLILLQLYPRLIPTDTSLLTNMFVTAVLLNFVCLALGLLQGWSPKKSNPILAALGFSVMFIAVIVIKGFGPATWLLLAIATAAALFLTWKKFVTAPL